MPRALPRPPPPPASHHPRQALCSSSLQKEKRGWRPEKPKPGHVLTSPEREAVEPRETGPQREAWSPLDTGRPAQLMPRATGPGNSEGGPRGQQRSCGGEGAEWVREPSARPLLGALLPPDSVRGSGVSPPACWEQRTARATWRLSSPSSAGSGSTARGPPLALPPGQLPRGAPGALPGGGLVEGGRALTCGCAADLGGVPVLSDPESSPVLPESACWAPPERQWAGMSPRRQGERWDVHRPSSGARSLGPVLDPTRDSTVFPTRPALGPWPCPLTQTCKTFRPRLPTHSRLCLGLPLPLSWLLITLTAERPRCPPQPRPLLGW